MKIFNERKYQEKFGNPMLKSHFADIILGSIIFIMIILIIAGVIQWLL